MYWACRTSISLRFHSLLAITWLPVEGCRTRFPQDWRCLRGLGFLGGREWGGGVGERDRGGCRGVLSGFISQPVPSVNGTQQGWLWQIRDQHDSSGIVAQSASRRHSQLPVINVTWTEHTQLPVINVTWTDTHSHQLPITNVTGTDTHSHQFLTSVTGTDTQSPITDQRGRDRHTQSPIIKVTRTEHTVTN